MAESDGPIKGLAQRPVINRFKKDLACTLSNAEWKERAARMAQVEAEIDVEKEHAKDVKANLKASMTSLEAERAKLGRAVRSSTEYRPVPVRVELDEDRGVAIEIREDTGSVVKERPLTDQERQLEIPGTPGDGETTDEPVDFGDKSNGGGTSEDSRLPPEPEGSGDSDDSDDDTGSGTVH